MADSPTRPFAPQERRRPQVGMEGVWDFDDLVVTDGPPLAAAPGFSAHAAADGPGFELLDNAGGRFAVDSETGIVTLANDALLQTEFGAVHDARLRVRENSGGTYELNLRLRISGLVPQMAEADPIDALAELPAPPSATPIAPRPTPAQLLAPKLCYFDAFPLAGEPIDLVSAEDEPFGAIGFAQTFPSNPVDALLRTESDLPRPAAADAFWLL